jgi:DNA-binding winged helix-turn-helix (wHTH) protein
MPHHTASASAKLEEKVLDEQRPRRKDIISFGPFRLVPTERLLEKDGVPLNLGSRALDLLIALVERATEVVSKKDLMARVWPNLVVDEGSLRFHITCLRKALGDGQSGVRYVTNVTGRGYCFVAPICRSASTPSLEQSLAVDRTSKLPTRLSRIVGRDKTVPTSTKDGGAVYFVDLGATDNPSFVPSAIASILGLSVTSDSPIRELLAFIRDQRMLLVLGGGERAIETEAALTTNPGNS